MKEKELTIEQKAQRYDEAIERLRNAFYDNSSRMCEEYRKAAIKILEPIFPELQVSEDEKIKKWIKKELESKYVVDNIVNDVMADKALAWIEKQGKQKPSDKLDPMFHKGNWVANKLGDPWRIDSFDNKNYQVSDGKGNYSYFPISKQNEMHLWSIKDANDGDVLATWAGAFIYNGNNGGGSCPGCYCGIDNLGGFKTGAEHHWTGKPVFPAAKEQRDALMKAMTDAGYTFDFEKKELKKIEQKSALSEKEKNEMFSDIITAIRAYYKCEREDLIEYFKNTHLPTKQEWSEEDELHIRELESLVKQEWAKIERENDKDKIHKMRDLSFFLKTLKPQLKQEWSEEDERMIDTIISDLERHGGKENSCYSAEINYLKSLKDRVQPQPKKEWSEEDERMYRGIHNLIYSTPYCNSRKEFSDWLESLKDRVQPKQEWSEEDKYNLSDIEAMIHTMRGDGRNADKLINWLKERIQQQKQ